MAFHVAEKIPEEERDLWGESPVCSIVFPILSGHYDSILGALIWLGPLLTLKGLWYLILLTSLKIY